jgi:hypothetical protein
MTRRTINCNTAKQVSSVKVNGIEGRKMS